VLRRIVFAFAFLIGIGGAPAFAFPTLCLPTTGIFSSLQEQDYITNGFAALETNFRGASAPVTDCSNESVEGRDESRILADLRWRRLADDGIRRPDEPRLDGGHRRRN
jgi:hypothetical protein